MSYDSFSEREAAESTDDTTNHSTSPLITPSTSSSHSWLAGKRGAAIGLGAGILIGLAGAATTGLFSGAAKRPAANPPTAAAGSAQSVTVASAEPSRVTYAIDTTGTVAAFDMLPVLPQRTGLQIQQVLVAEGDLVKAGQALAVLDDSVLRAELSQAQAQLESARAVVRQKQAALKQTQATAAEAQSNLRRYQGLANQGAISRQDLESRSTSATTAQEAVGVAQANISSAEADVRSGEARVQQLETQLEQTVVRAPASGIVVAPTSEAGAAKGTTSPSTNQRVAATIAHVGDVTSSQPLLAIIRNGFLELQVRVPENQLPDIRPDAMVRITSDVDRRLNLQGRVREIAPLIDPQTRQATVRIDLPESDLLRPGMFLQAAITSRVVPGLTVPAKAVLPQASGSALVYMLAADNTVRAQTVELGARQNIDKPDQARVEIKRGLQAGDRVVVAGAGYLKDGDRVEVVTEPGASADGVSRTPAQP